MDPERRTCARRIARVPAPAARDLLRHHDLRRLWLAHTGSVVGDGLHSIALVWLVFSTMGGGPGGLVLLQLGYAIPSLSLAIAASAQVATLVVPPLGGIAFEVVGPATLLLADALSFIWSAAMLARVSPVPRIAMAERRPLIQEATDGLRLGLMTIGAVGLLGVRGALAEPPNP